ncbi:retrovirus-related pol polyprotein from transposon TNT 1-94, partial [Tanacetum coccineum]
TMTDVNVDAPAEQAPTMVPPARTDEQILSRIRWVPIGKSNCYLDMERSQSNPNYKMVVDILMQTNFFRAFVASSIQQFWDTIQYDKIARCYKCQLDEQWFNLTKDKIARCYKCQLDEQWFNLTKDTLREALQITPVDSNNAFSSPPTTDALVKFVNDLGLTDDIRGAQYYNAYLEKVAKHQRYLAGEEVSDPDSPAPKPAKATKQSKPLAPKGATMKPKPVPAKPKEKKRKLVTETSEAPSPAKRSKAGKVAKKRTKKSSPRLVDEFVDEGVPENEPRIGDEEADLQKALEESLKDVHSVRQGPLPPVVIREPESGKFQPLPEVPGKGKDKVGEEQAAQVLLNLQTPKKKSPAEQYIFQRRTPAPTEHSGHEESSSLYAELGLSDSDTESDEEMPPVVTSGAQDKGQTGPNPRIQDEGQAGPNPGDDAVPQPQSTPVVHAGPNLEHTDVEATDASNRPHPEQMDEGFIATAYPKVQENLKLTVEEPVIPEEPASSTRKLSSL